jgi:hypothetical protein
VVPRADGVSTPVADTKYKAGSVQKQGDMRVDRMLGSLRHAKTTVSFHTKAYHLEPGELLSVGQNCDQSHPCTQASPDEKLLVIGRKIRGGVEGVVKCLIETVATERPHRPALVTPRPRIAGVQSAIVVGPDGEEIHTDEFGRVRVQFHWDRDHSYTDDSSCWIRVAHGWSGKGFGHINIPRVGHEVLVGFFDGDPDRPIIVGCVYDQTNQVPYELPKHKTRSGWRSESSDGTKRKEPRGYNEIMFEDMMDKERIHVQAQKDFTTIIKNDERRDIDVTRTTCVGNIDWTSIGEQCVITVGNLDGLGNGIVILKNGPEIKIATTTGAKTGASIKLAGEDVWINASGHIHLHSGKGIDIGVQQGTIDIDGGTDVNINCKPPPDAAPRYADVDTVPGAEKPEKGQKQEKPWWPGATPEKGPPPDDYPE